MNKGITVAGTLIADVLKTIDAYPEKGRLVSIRKITRSVGGCVPNTGVDLARFGGVPVRAVGRVGDDALGRFVTEKLVKEGVNAEDVFVTGGADTSFTDVMTETQTGERTFFSAAGANMLFAPDDVPERAKACRIFHLGYLILLDKFDAPDDEFGTQAARFLRDLQLSGVKTSIDVVSEASARFRRILPPALKFCDYAVINELEGGYITGIAPRDGNGKLLRANVRAVLKEICASGAKTAVVHCPEGGFMLSGEGYFEQPSLLLPKGYIQGTVGAGDAFCAGILYAFYQGALPQEALRFAALSAAANLSATDSVGGAVSADETRKLSQKYPWRTFAD